MQSKLPEPAATEKQIKYARDLGLSFPAGITKLEMSQLLDCHLHGGRRASENLVSWAVALRIPATKYISEPELLDNVVGALARSKRNRDLIAWFGYWVARDVLDAKQAMEDCNSPFSPLLQNIAWLLEDEGKVVQSIGRYNGRTLVEFGSEGACRRTAAYERVATIIKDSVIS